MEFIDITKGVNGVCRVTVPKSCNIPIGVRVRVTIEVI